MFDLAIMSVYLGPPLMQSAALANTTDVEYIWC